MNTDRIRTATTMTDIHDIARYALSDETGIEDYEVRQIILAKAGLALIYNAGDPDSLIVYLRNVAYANGRFAK